MAPDETAAIHAAAYDDVDRARADLYFSGSLMHGGREREGLEGFRAVHRQAVAGAHSALAFIASTGVAYASWVAGDLRGGVDVLDRAIPLAGGDPRFGIGDVFGCPVAHVHQTRGLCRGFLGELEGARADFQRAVELAEEYGDPETLAATHANHALLLASIGEHRSALEVAARGNAVAEQAANLVHVIACSVPTAVAEAGLGRYEAALELADAGLASVRQRRLGLYFEPVLLATVARSMLGLGEPARAATAARRAVDIADARGLGTCALLAPITLAQVLMADPATADPAAVEGVLSRAMRLARATDARAMIPVIHQEQVAAARLWNDVTGHAVTAPPPSSR
jgi:tetratricopeptide (TPR) repeat protein